MAVAWPPAALSLDRLTARAILDLADCPLTVQQTARVVGFVREAYQLGQRYEREFDRELQRRLGVDAGDYPDYGG